MVEINKTKFKAIKSLFTPRKQFVYFIDQYSILKNKPEAVMAIIKANIQAREIDRTIVDILTIKDGQGLTPLHYAILKNKPFLLLQYCHSRFESFLSLCIESIWPKVLVTHCQIVSVLLTYRCSLFFPLLFIF